MTFLDRFALQVFAEGEDQSSFCKHTIDLLDSSLSSCGLKQTNGEPLTSAVEKKR